MRCAWIIELVAIDEFETEVFNTSVPGRSYISPLGSSRTLKRHAIRDDRYTDDATISPYFILSQSTFPIRSLWGWRTHFHLGLLYSGMDRPYF
jgi:hypothetical protein